MHVFNINPNFLKELYNFNVLIRFDIKSVFVTIMRLASCKAEFTLDASLRGASRHCASKPHVVCSYTMRHGAFL